MDALTQCLEAYVGTHSNPLVDALAKEGIACCAGWLRKAYRDGRDQTARERMALGSLLGGLALANAGLGAVHGIAGPLGGMVPAPHGAACGRLLPLVMTANIEALQSESHGSLFLQRYRELAVLLSGQPSAEPMDGAAWVAELCEALKLPGLSRYGLTRELIPELVSKAQKASSMQSNPVVLDEKTLIAVCERAL
jgi:alcohol dehydrogenase class IV